MNWDSGVRAGDIKVCGSSCWTLENGNTTNLQTNVSYSLTGVNLWAGGTVTQWATNAGTLAANQLTVSGAGTISMYVQAEGGSGGYIYSTASSHIQVTQVSASFQLPTFDSGNSFNYTMWVGLGGFANGSTPFFQAGVDYVAINNSYVPFWEYLPSKCYPNGSTPLNCSWNWGKKFTVGDEISVLVTSNGATSTFSIHDQRLGNAGWWNRTIAHAPTLNNGQWSAEFIGRGTPQQVSVTFTGLGVNGESASMLDGWFESFSSIVTASALGGGPGFTATWK
ncbi:MAG: hypothetical protein ABSA63_08725 [Thermoplasmata archaeon]|jgi:hypothetical protein